MKLQRHGSRGSPGANFSPHLWLEAGAPDGVATSSDLGSGGQQPVAERRVLLLADVKPSNVLINKEGHVKMCDFGISGYLVDSVAKTMDAGCKPYMAVSGVPRSCPEEAARLRHLAVSCSIRNEASPDPEFPSRGSLLLSPLHPFLTGPTVSIWMIGFTSVGWLVGPVGVADTPRWDPQVWQLWGKT